MRDTWWLFSFLLLSGCMGPVNRPWPTEQPSGTNIPTGKLDFGWKLSGDRAVAPLQVFSDASRTWLQWLPGQVLPIILGASEQGEQVLSYLRQGPYTIIEGHWPALLFRSARQQARARRSDTAHVATAITQERVSSHPSSSTSHPVQYAARPNAALHAAEAPQPFFSVSHTDLHLRQALTRWAGLSGWRFEPEHWAVDIDIPLSASAKFSEDFVSSVQALLASTELSDRPLQPCFYSNQVLRIVPVAEPCDRTLGDGAST
jgi:hypothetical protein